MYLLPAIDILGGRVVRLARGDYEAVTVYGEDPASQAITFAEQGATWVHVVDLDGARLGKPENAQVIKRIIAESGLHVEVGGGIRTLQAVEELLEAGASRLVLGTSLVRDPSFARAAVARFGGDCFTAGIDAKGGEVAIEGWREGAGVDAAELAREMVQAGFRHLVYTDIARDGMQTGVDSADYARMARAFGHPVIVSGGISCEEDIRRLAPAAASIEGVIAGRAVYEGTLTVADGVRACEELTEVGPC